MDVPQLQQFYRQYLQQFSSLSIPSGQFLKDEAIQKCLSARFFNDENFTCASISYQKHTLDRVIKAIESAITDPEEEVRPPLSVLIVMIQSSVHTMLDVMRNFSPTDESRQSPMLSTSTGQGWLKRRLTTSLRRKR